MIRGAVLARRMGNGAPAPPGETVRVVLIPTRAGFRRSLLASTSSAPGGGATSAHEQEGPTEEHTCREREQQREVRLRDHRLGTGPAQCEHMDAGSGRGLASCLDDGAPRAGV